jgi:two-component system sensor histidine kinase DevS
MSEPRADSRSAVTRSTTPAEDAFASAVLEAAPDGILIAEPDGAIVLANRHASALFGYDHDHLLTLSVDDLLPDRLREGHKAHRQQFRDAPTVRPMGVGVELRGRRRDGSELPVEISLSPMRVDDTDLVVAVVRDISSRVEADEQLRSAQRALAVADDRERIARDLHDTVIQRLFASGLQLQAVSSRVDPEVRTRLEGIVDGLDETIRELRTAIFALHTTDESVLGLRAELLDIVVEASATLGFEPRLELAGAVETIDSQVRDQLVPVLREALANVARHAKASTARVSVEAGDIVTVVVVDDGCGMPDDLVSGNGLTNLRQRAARLGGALTIRRRELGGTELRWEVPADPPPG